MQAEVDRVRRGGDIVRIQISGRVLEAPGQLAFAGQGCGLFRSGGGGGPMFYAYDKKTGDVVHEMALPAATCGNPMTYMVNGKQFIAVSVGAPAELIALALP